MTLYFRKRIRMGSFWINLSKSGASVSIKNGPVTVNPKRRTTWVNLPGGFYWRQKWPK